MKHFFLLCLIAQPHRIGRHLRSPHPAIAICNCRVWFAFASLALIAALVAGCAPGRAEMTRSGWSTRKIALVLYPFGAGAMAVNVFFASLIGSWIGLPVLSTGWSIVIGACIGIPATWVFARHIRDLMESAE